MENIKSVPNLLQALFILAVLFGAELLIGAAQMIVSPILNLMNLIEPAEPK